MKNLPNRITISRIFMIFIFVLLANLDADKINFVDISSSFSYYSHVVAYIIAILAGFTDLLDGYLARKYGWESDFGKLMDPLADKIFIVATFIMMTDYGLVPAWMTIAIISREFMVTGLRLLATNKGVVISADKGGKLKTGLQMIVLLIGGASWINFLGIDLKRGSLFGLPLWNIWYTGLLVIVFITIYSGVTYFVRHRSLYAENT